MRQPFASFKIIRSIKAAIVLCGVLLGASGCSTLGLERSNDVVVDSGVVVASLKRDKESLQAKVASLQSENARMARRLLNLERESKKAAVSPKAPELRAAVDTKISDSVQTSDVAKNSDVDVSAPVLKTVVDVANAEVALPDAPVPVDNAPRLVQPSFASSEQPVFENEAKGGEIKLSSILWGVHLASYRKPDEARVGWRKLQRENPDQLGLLEPRIERIQVRDKGEFLRLIGGGFSSEEKARALCNSLQGKGMFCSVASFGGERLSLAKAG